MINETFDLTLEREVPVPPELVWQAWTQPVLLKQWFCPKPWQTTECEMDLRPGGRFNTVMCGPDGEVVPNQGCYLEVIENRRLTFTSCLTEGFRPAETPFFTATLSLQPTKIVTLYSVLAMHKNAEDQKSHADMGFEHGWSAALDQLVELMKR